MPPYVLWHFDALECPCSRLRRVALGSGRLGDLFLGALTPSALTAFFLRLAAFRHGNGGPLQRGTILLNAKRHVDVGTERALLVADFHRRLVHFLPCLPDKYAAFLFADEDRNRFAPAAGFLDLCLGCIFGSDGILPSLDGVECGRCRHRLAGTGMRKIEVRMPQAGIGVRHCLGRCLPFVWIAYLI